MALRNPWVGYIDRSFEQMRDNILSKFPARVPEITDLTESSTTTKEVSIWAGLLEMLGYYLDRKAREVFLPTAKRFASGVKWASTVGYRIRGSVAASADITFRFSAPAGADFTIPAGTQVATLEDVRFITTAAATIPAGSNEATAPARQWVRKSSQVLGYSDGTANQVFALEAAVVDNSITVTVNGLGYSPVETLLYSGPADQHFVGTLNAEGNMTLQFGDGLNGQIPPVGADVTSNYYLTGGTTGNVAARTLTVIGTLTGIPDGLTMTAFNLNRAGGGSNDEGLEDLRKRIPLFIRTQNRAVTRQDYKDVAMLAPGVAQAGLEFSCGKTVDVYVAPVGGGVAASPLLDSVVAFFEDKRMSTTKVRALSAGAANIQLVMLVNAFANYANATVAAAISDNLVAFFGVEKQALRGSVSIGDIYQVIEGTEGVQNSVVTLMNVLPYARPLNNAEQLDWDRAVQPLSTDVLNWRLKFFSATTFQVTRGSVYKGLFAVGDLVDLGEVKLTVNAGQTPGFEWQFTTYPYNRGSIQLEEPSMPVAFAEDLSITVTGGI